MRGHRLRAICPVTSRRLSIGGRNDRKLDASSPLNSDRCATETQPADAAVACARVRRRTNFSRTMSIYDKLVCQVRGRQGRLEQGDRRCG